MEQPVNESSIGKGGSRRKVPFLILALMMLLPVGSSFAQTVKVNWKKQAPVADYRTYVWKDSKNQRARFYRQWVQKDVDAELAKKGLNLVTADKNPDVYMYYHIVTQEVTDATTTDDGFG